MQVSPGDRTQSDPSFDFSLQSKELQQPCSKKCRIAEILGRTLAGLGGATTVYYMLPYLISTTVGGIVGASIFFGCRSIDQNAETSHQNLRSIFVRVMASLFSGGLAAYCTYKHLECYVYYSSDDKMIALSGLPMFGAGMILWKISNCCGSSTKEE